MLLSLSSRLFGNVVGKIFGESDLFRECVLDDEIFKPLQGSLTTATSTCKRKRSALKRDQSDLECPQ